MKYFFKPAALFIIMLLVLATVGMKNKFDYTSAWAMHQPAGYVENAGTADSGIAIKNVNSIVVDNNNVKWFSTGAGMIRFDGNDWELYAENENIPNKDLKGLAHALNEHGQEIWIASPAGATMIRLSADSIEGVETLTPENSSLFGGDVVGVAAGINSIRWFGTERGISAMYNGKWLTLSYDL